LNHVQEEFQIEIPIEKLFSLRTVSEVARLIDEYVNDPDARGVTEIVEEEYEEGII